MKKNNSVIRLLLYICAGIFAAVLIKFFVIDVLYINGTSMEPQFKEGQRIIVNKAAYGIQKPFSAELLVKWKEPETDDVIIYLYNDKLVIKRCAATEGTVLEYSYDSEYNLYAGDKIIPLTEIQYHRMKSSSVVPEGMILAVGDNYAESIDSRMYGFVPVKNILGKVICR